MRLMEYEKHMFDELFEDDSLLIASKGIGVHSLLLNLIEAYNCGTNLILIIGCSSDEEQFCVESFKQRKDEVERVPKIVNSDVSTSERSKLYSNGNTLFVTSRILVVDMLVGRISIEEITGIIVSKAHTIADSSQEAFILRLYRMQNKTGFIKCLSQSPTSFNQGFARLDRVMRLLFVSKVFLWPRFHASVISSFESREKPEVIEIRLTLTEEMRTIQFALMDLINTCLKEISKSNVSLLIDAEGITAENAISPGFDKMLRHQFDPVWHQLSSRTKRLISDIKLLRQLLFLLTNEDCVTFYRTIKAIKENVRLDNQSDWFFWDQTQTMYRSAKCRLFKLQEESEEAQLESNQKWTSFHEVISEIKEETAANENDINVIVVVEDDRTIKKLKDVLEKGANLTLNEIFERNEKMICETPAINSADEEQSKSRKKKVKDDNVISLTQIVKSFDKKEESFRKTGSFNVHYHCLSEGAYKFESLLNDLKPWFFVLYDPDMQIVRQIEVYQAKNCSPERVKVYFFLYDGSAEEQKYLTSLRKEKLAFESLISQKSSLVIPIERDGKSDLHPDLIRAQPQEATSSRQAGGQISRSEVIQQRIIVDMREFRSVLPSIIHKRGIDIDPVTIEIGDYILTPDTCVERKSVSDLIGSLNNGRLYTQCQMMTRHYKRSIILIEFDQNKSFNFKGKCAGFGRRVERGDHDVVAKLILLTLHFSQLRLIWSPSPYFSAEMFEYLKHEKEQPVVEDVLSITDQQLPAEHYLDKYDIATKDFLLNLPGVNLYNVYAIMNKVQSIAQLCEKSKEEISSILGNAQNGETLYSCLHSNLVTHCVNDALKAQQAVKKYKRFSKKAKK